MMHRHSMNATLLALTLYLVLGAGEPQASRRGCQPTTFSSACTAVDRLKHAVARYPAGRARAQLEGNVTATDTTLTVGEKSCYRCSPGPRGPTGPKGPPGYPGACGLAARLGHAVPLTHKRALHEHCCSLGFFPCRQDRQGRCHWLDRSCWPRWTPWIRPGRPKRCNGRHRTCRHRRQRRCHGCQGRHWACRRHGCQGRHWDCGRHGRRWT